MLETERLLLRPPVLADFEPSAAMFADAAVTAHLGTAPLDRPTAWSRFLRDVGHWTVHGFGLFSVVEKSSGAYAGKVGHARFERTLGSRDDLSIEASWILRYEFHGKGYAFEAAACAQTWFDTLQRVPTACLIACSNAASTRLATRLGYREVERMTGSNPTIVMVRQPSEG